LPCNRPSVKDNVIDGDGDPVDRLAEADAMAAFFGRCVSEICPEPVDEASAADGGIPRRCQQDGGASGQQAARQPR
jgi:hypothetical protein